MSNTNTPQQRPVQHNPYSITPMQQPADARGDVPAPPPMEGTPKTAGGPQQPETASGSGARPPSSGGGYKTGGGSAVSPHLSFMPSLYAATPQQGPTQGRVSPGPSLGPSEQQESTNRQQPQQAQQPARFTAFSGTFGAGNTSGNGASSGQDTRGAFNASWGSSAYASAMSGGAGGFHGNDFPNYAVPSGGGGGGGGNAGSGGGFGGSTFGGTFRPSAGHHQSGGGHGGGGNGGGFSSTFGPPREFTPYAPPSHANGGGSGVGAPGGGQISPTGQSQGNMARGGRGGRDGAGGVPRGIGTGRIAHTFLNNKLRYIALPAELFVQLPPQRLQTQMGEIDRPIQMYSGRGREMQTVCPTADLFVAQLPFNMELSALQLIFDAVASISCDIMHAAPHYKRGRSYDGCAFVKVSQACAAILVETFHKAALFDQEGVWIADGPEQRDALAQYCGFMQQKSPQERRQILQKPIPFSAMTVEFANRSYSF